MVSGRPEPSDVALLSLATTPGLRRADDALAALIRGTGASCELLRVRIGPEGRLRRHIVLVDLVESWAARRTARAARGRARALIVSSATTALLVRGGVPMAVRFDSPVALNRRGWSGAWQRAAERRAFRRAELLLPWGEVAAGAAREVTGPGGPPLVRLPVPVEAVRAKTRRDVDAAMYAGYPRKRGLELACAAWAASELGPAGRRLLVGGLDAARGRAWLRRCRVPEPPGIEWAGPLPREAWLRRVARAGVFVNASRWEDHGLSQLEALAAGTPLVTVPSPGAYEALPLARALDAALVAGDLAPANLAAAIRAGLALSEGERAGYARRADALLAPYRPEAVRRTLVAEVLPALGIRLP